MSTTKEMKDELIPLIVSRFNHSRPHFSTQEQEAINKKYGFQEYTEKLYHCSRCGEADPSLLYKCKKCFITHYCSLECENADWTQHKDLCQHGKPKTAHELKTRAPLNKKHLSDSLARFMAASHQQLSNEQLQQFVQAAVQYIFQSRLETTATKLLRTYNRKKRKATENLMNQIIDSD